MRKSASASSLSSLDGKDAVAAAAAAAAAANAAKKQKPRAPTKTKAKPRQSPRLTRRQVLAGAAASAGRAALHDEAPSLLGWLTKDGADLYKDDQLENMARKVPDQSHQSRPGPPQP